LNLKINILMQKPALAKYFLHGWYSVYFIIKMSVNRIKKTTINQQNSSCPNF